MLVKLSPVSPSTLLDEDFHLELGEGVDLPRCQTCKFECGCNRVYPFKNVAQVDISSFIFYYSTSLKILHKFGQGLNNLNMQPQK